jgi:hypothetical protein
MFPVLKFTRAIPLTLDVPARPPYFLTVPLSRLIESCDFVRDHRQVQKAETKRLQITPFLLPFIAPPFYHRRFPSLPLKSPNVQAKQCCRRWAQNTIQRGWQAKSDATRLPVKGLPIPVETRTEGDLNRLKTMMTMRKLLLLIILATFAQIAQLEVLSCLEGHCAAVTLGNW